MDFLLLCIGNVYLDVRASYDWLRTFERSKTILAHTDELRTYDDFKIPHDGVDYSMTIAHKCSTCRQS